jgi:hypothetical protein
MPFKYQDELVAPDNTDGDWTDAINGTHAASMPARIVAGQVDTLYRSAT